MKILRFMTEGQAKYGILEADGIIREIRGSVYENFEFTNHTYKAGEVSLLAPCEPSKIICVGLNYKAHIDEFKRDREGIPEEPILFMKPSTAVTAHGGSIELPPASAMVHYEGELAVVIGKRGKNLSPEVVGEHIFGYTCANDVTARDLQRKDGQWTRGKGFDTFAPIGPWIETELNPENLSVQSYLNGELKQDSSTRYMIFPVPQLVSFISNIMTLLPGDVILTGTPQGVGQIKEGDRVKVVIEGIGTLENTVKRQA